MTQNYLQLNNYKSDMLLFTPPNFINLFRNSFGPLSTNIKSSTWNLGVILNSDFNFHPHINKLVQSCFHQLRVISKIKSLIPHSDLEKIIHAFIIFRLDYCNSLLSGTSQKSFSHIQQIQNAASRWFQQMSSHHPGSGFPLLAPFAF